MDILFAASEVAPLSKTGGLGDVAGALPAALASRGHAVAVVSPRYGTIDPVKHGYQASHRAIRVRGEATTVHVKKEGRLSRYLVEHEHYFGSRRGLYGDHGRATVLVKPNEVRERDLVIGGQFRRMSSQQ